LAKFLVPIFTFLAPAMGFTLPCASSTEPLAPPAFPPRERNRKPATCSCGHGCWEHGNALALAQVGVWGGSPVARGAQGP